MIIPLHLHGWNWQEEKRKLPSWMISSSAAPSSWRAGKLLNAAGSCWILILIVGGQGDCWILTESHWFIYFLRLPHQDGDGFPCAKHNGENWTSSQRLIFCRGLNWMGSPTKRGNQGQKCKNKWKLKKKRESEISMRSSLFDRTYLIWTHYFTRTFFKYVDTMCHLYNWILFWYIGNT